MPEPCKQVTAKDAGCKANNNIYTYVEGAQLLQLPQKLLSLFPAICNTGLLRTLLVPLVPHPGTCKQLKANRMTEVCIIAGVVSQDSSSPRLAMNPQFAKASAVLDSSGKAFCA